MNLKIVLLVAIGTAILLALFLLPYIKHVVQHRDLLDLAEDDLRERIKIIRPIVMQHKGMGNERFGAVEAQLSDHKLTEGNTAKLLADGPASYEAMFGAIESAKHHVHVEMFIIADGKVGSQFAELIKNKARAGVKVRVLYDAIGSRDTPDDYFKSIEETGVEIHPYRPLLSFESLSLWKINSRHHRKVLIVDGEVAYTGGINISDTYRNSSFSVTNDDDESNLDDHWRDTQIELRGPVVHSFQKSFERLWLESEDNANEFSPENAYYPELDSVGDLPIRMVTSHGGNDEYSIYDAYIAAVLNAKKSIKITQAYFSPNEDMVDVLIEKANEGVDIQLVLPGFSDSTMTFFASRAYYGRLLEAGIKVYERKDAMLHAKTAIIDDYWSTVGSSNLDYRSFVHNNEANVTIHSEAFAPPMNNLFDVDKELSEELSLDKWKKRPMREKIYETIGRWLGYWF